jgi:hypothetical protein
VKTALIPPFPELERFGHGSIHLLLAHLKDEGYLAHYRAERSAGAYTILDNGAHENQSGMHATRLLRRAVSLRASEIVIPDHLFDADDTVHRAKNALQALERDLIDVELLGPNFMLVPQGRTSEDWRTCLQSLVWNYDRYHRMYPNVFKPPVIGISKDYEYFDGGIPKLLERNVMPMGLDVHLLGWGRDLWTLGEMARRWPQIRSTDSAKPFVYAIDRIALDPSKPVPEYPKRTETYFETVLDDEQADIAKHNVKVFRDLANDN